MNCRLFEAAGSGAVVITEDRPVLGDLFKRGTEVLDFRTTDELVDRCRQVLESPEQFTATGDAASVRAHADHTYEHQLNEILSSLGVR
jgi:spore maturation protein CgeB